jgi:hypothetical protein
MTLAAELLAGVFSSDFWDGVGTEKFCMGCTAFGANNPERDCDAEGDFLSSACHRCSRAEDIEAIIKECATQLCKLIDA